MKLHSLKLLCKIGVCPRRISHLLKLQMGVCIRGDFALTELSVLLGLLVKSSLLAGVSACVSVGT